MNHPVPTPSKPFGVLFLCLGNICRSPLGEGVFIHLARERGVLSVFDGVCATAAERFAMDAWGADVYLTGSQKAVGLPAGLALLVFSPRAMAARAAPAAWSASSAVR